MKHWQIAILDYYIYTENYYIQCRYYINIEFRINKKFYNCLHKSPLKLLGKFSSEHSAELNVRAQEGWRY